MYADMRPAAACVVAVVLALCARAAFAIEAPATAAPAAPVTPIDRTPFQHRLVEVDRLQSFRGIDVDRSIATMLADADATTAVARLESRAAAGSDDANVALVRTQHWCAAMMAAARQPAGDEASKLSASLPADRLPGALGVLEAQRAFTDRAAAACQRAPFRYQDIERRLRAAAQAGHASSANELARFTNDSARRDALIEDAAKGGYGPAQHTLAVSRLYAVQRGETTENVDTIRQLLKQAGTTVPAAKVDLANCMAAGCDGHPADSATAAAFGVDAARDGDPSAFVAMLRMPWRTSLKVEEIAAWQMFGDRLNEEGCTGGRYLEALVTFTQVLAQFEKGLKPEQLASARAHADRYWSQFAARARHEQRCD
jgi:hypothetical protein